MRAVVQRVDQASVQVDGVTLGGIDTGILVYLGVGVGDTERDLEYLSNKVAGLRIFPDETGHMNRSVMDVGGSALVISQFTLHGDVRRGKRPSFTASMEPTAANDLYERFCQSLEATGLACARGRFGAMMHVSSVNNGPVTLLLDSKKLF